MTLIRNRTDDVKIDLNDEQIYAWEFKSDHPVYAITVKLFGLFFVAALLACMFLAPIWLLAPFFPAASFWLNCCIGLVYFCLSLVGSIPWSRRLFGDRFQMPEFDERLVLCHG